MNLILLTPEDFISTARVRLTGRRFEHIVSVLRAIPGQRLKVGLVGGRIGQGVITDLAPEAITIEVILDTSPPAPADISLLLALPRPKVLKRVLQGVTTMGVKQIVLFGSWRVEKSYWQSPLLLESSLREQLLLGLEQGGDTILPDILLFNRFKPFVEDHLPDLLGSRAAWLAHPSAETTCPENVTGPGALIVGPEGGFIDYEIERLTEAGCLPVRFGPRPLKVETAIPAFLGRLLAI